MIVVVEAAAEAVALQDAANLKRQRFEIEGGRKVSFFAFCFDSWNQQIPASDATVSFSKCSMVE
jgi:hypothetical protein